MSNTKKIMIAIIILLFIIASYLVYKRFSKLKTVAAASSTATPIETAPVTTVAPSIDKESLKAELAILTPRLAAEKYKLYNMEQYAARLKANIATSADTLNAYYNGTIVPQQKIVGDLESKIGQISTVINS